MSPDRLIALCAALITLGLLAILPSAFYDYRLGSKAENWETKTGYVDRRTDIISYRLRCFMRSAKYSLIEYRFEDKEGNWIKGSAHAPLVSEIYDGASIQVRVNPNDDKESLPTLSIPGYKNANAWIVLFALAASIGMALVTRRLWLEGAKTLRRGMSALP